MEWKITKHIISSDNKVEKIYCELLLNFKQSIHNSNDQSPVIHLYFYDSKVDYLWYECVQPPRKECEITFNYFNRMPKVKLHSGETRIPYDNFTLEMCQNKAVEIFTNKLKDILVQCGGI